MSNGGMLDALLRASEKKTLTTEQGMPLLIAGVAEILQNQAEAKTEREVMQTQIQLLVAKDAELEEDIGELKKRSNLWDGINSILLIVGTFFGVSK